MDNRGERRVRDWRSSESVAPSTLSLSRPSARPRGTARNDDDHGRHSGMDARKVLAVEVEFESSRSDRMGSLVRLPLPFLPCVRSAETSWQLATRARRPPRRDVRLKAAARRDSHCPHCSSCCCSCYCLSTFTDQATLSSHVRPTLPRQRSRTFERDHLDDDRHARLDRLCPVLVARIPSRDPFGPVAAQSSLQGLDPRNQVPRFAAAAAASARGQLGASSSAAAAAATTGRVPPRPTQV